MDLIDIFKECWENCSVADQVAIHNAYAVENNAEDEIFSNDEDFFETYFEGRPAEAVRATYFGKYQYADEYVWFNGYGNLDSSDFVDDMPIYVDDLAEWFAEGNNYRDIDYISEMSDFCDACRYGIDEDEEEDEDETEGTDED